MTVDKIMEIVTTAVASVGGIGGVIAIACTVIKIFGGNSVKAKIAASKIDLNNTLDGGLATIGSDIKSKMHTDITVDISSKLDKAVERQLVEQKQINKLLVDDVNMLRDGMAECLRIMADFKAISLARREEILASAKLLQSDKHSVEIEQKCIATITIDDIAESVVDASSSVLKNEMRRSSVL